jgi:hypothetical protein
MSAALLYLPNATSPAPMEEAIAYAALKELEHRTGESAAASESPSPNQDMCSSVPLNNGCYLLDTVNEAGHTLQDEDQLVAIVCEQLYAMTFLDLETSVREHRNRRYQRATLRGKGRVYESFGLAIRYVPRKQLAQWASARLGGGIVKAVLDDPVQVNVEQRARAFIERVGLRTEALEEALRQSDVTQQAEKMLNSLRQTRLRQLESRARSLLQTMREQYLPTLSARVEEKAAREIDHLQDALADEIRMTLEDFPAGGVRTTLSLLNQLHNAFDDLGATIARRVRRHQVQLSRSLGTVSETYYSLRTVTMGTPPWPVTLSSAITVLLLPLLYLFLLISQVVLPQSANWALVAWAILATGVLGVSAFVAYRLLRQKRTLAEQHVDMVRERFRLESAPVVHRELGEIYLEAQRTIDQTRAELEALTAQLQEVGERFAREEETYAHYMEALTLPGPSRSAVSAEIAEHLYRASVPDVPSLFPSLAESAGTVAEWLARCTESAEAFEPWLYEQVSRFGADHVTQRVDQFTITDALTSNGSRLEPVMERLFDRAHPLWNYDPRFLRRAKTERMTFVGIDATESSWSWLNELAAEAESDIILHNSDDPSALIVMTVHQGVPLFALRRIGQYRNHYAEALWRGTLPVHTTNKLALADDLVPIRRRPLLRPPALFSTGLALAIIRRDPDGRYVAPRAGGKTIRLSAQKERAVALMGMDGPTCREVQRRLDAMVSAEGTKAIDARLEEYATDVPGLADWEVRGIVEFGRVYATNGGGT